MKSHAWVSFGAMSTLALCIGIGLSANASAQTSAAAAAVPDRPDADPGDKEGEGKKEAQTLTGITVTGSNLPTTPDAVAVPVTILGSEQIERIGVSSNVLEILRKMIPSFAGRGNAGNSNANNNNQNTAGGSQVQLRNLDTLVLINGRRVATSGINGIGGKSFVDVNQIPVGAIDRIEVLTDGSSAIYGSDAIGGVVNIILKSDYEGVEVGTRFGFADGGYQERSANFVAGTQIHGGNITVMGSTSHTDPLFQNQRPFSTPLTGRSSQVPGAVGANGLNPGALLNPNLNSPRDQNPTGSSATAGSIGDLIGNGTYSASTPAGIAGTYDLSKYQTLLLKQDQNALATTFNSALLPDNRLTVFGDVELAKTKSYTQFLPVVTAVSVPVGAPYNPLTTALPNVQFGYLPFTHNFNNETRDTRVTLGLRGDITDDWNWEAAYVYSSSLLTQKQSGLIYKPNLARAIAGGYDASGNPVAGGTYSRIVPGYNESNPFVLVPSLDPFARANGVIPGSLDGLYGTETIDASSRLRGFDAKIVGNLFDLPAGSVGLALGASYRSESLKGRPDANGYNTGPTAQRWIGGTYADPFSSSRDISAVYAETRVPITGADWNAPGLHDFDLIGAVRAEHYSDVGGSVVPKIGFHWQPFDSQVTLRGTYAKSFTAPTLYAMFGPTDTRIVGAGVIQSVFGLPAMPINGEDGNNPQLMPSKAKTAAIGVTIVPEAVKGLRLTIDYSDIRQKGFPGGIGFTNILQSINQYGSASQFFNNLGVGNFPGSSGATQPFTQPGDLLNYLRGSGSSLNLYAIDQFRNLGGIKEQSVNVSGSYEHPTETVGTFSLATAGAIFLHYKFQALPGQPFYEYAGYVTNGGTGVQGTIPKYRFYTSFDWRYNKWDLMVGNNFISSVTDVGPGGIVFANSTTLKRIHVGAYATWDLRAAYSEDTPSERFRFIKGWDVAVGVNNVGNRMPPRAPQAYTDNNADVSTYSPLGRLFYLSATIKF
jgi:iron complex outermembrane receptor protein